MTTGIENNNLFIYLPDAAISTGWTNNADGSCSHQSCNSGSVVLDGYTLVPGKTYRYTYVINSITSGYVQCNLGAQKTVSGLVDETGVANSTQISIYANGNCNVSNFVIELVSDITNAYSQNTIAFSEKLNKWVSFYTFIPESAFSMFVNTYSFQNGNAYVHDNASPSRGNFYGTQYPATIYFASNQQPVIAKTFIGLSYQANQLLITPPSGITTQTGQTSQLAPWNFEQAQLSNGAKIYSSEGLYHASFMRAYPDLINGNQLKGNYLNVGLQDTSPSSIMTIFTVEIDYAKSFQNIR